MRLPVALTVFAAAVSRDAAQPLPDSDIDSLVLKILAETGVPSSSIAVVRDKSIYVKAYDDARLNPKTPAAPKMRYKIASHSKQIAATAILLLAQQHKLSQFLVSPVPAVK